MTTPCRGKLALVALCLVAATCSACSSSNGTVATTGRPTTTTIPAAAVSYVTLNGKRVRVPTERPGQPISPLKDVGQQIVVTRSGVVPETLYAFRNKPIVWTNLTDHPIRVVFSHYPLSRGSGNIAPGRTFSYTVHNNTVISYSTTSGAFGVVAVSILPSTNAP